MESAAQLDPADTTRPIKPFWGIQRTVIIGGPGGFGEAVARRLLSRAIDVTVTACNASSENLQTSTCAGWRRKDENKISIQGAQMNRIKQLDPTQATGLTKELLDGTKAKFVVVPNLLRVLGNAPAALEGYLKFSGSLAGGSFNGKVREQISLAVAESNMCGYCLSAHTFVAGRLGLTEEEINDARHASAANDKTDAILKFARSIVV